MPRARRCALARVHIRLLGGLDVVVDGAPAAEFESATAKALLALMAYDVGHRLPRARVAEMLWPDRPQGQASANLRHTLATLRALLGDRARPSPVLVTDRSGVGLDAAQVWVDVVEVRRAASTPPTVPGAVTAWEQVRALARGTVLEGFDPALGSDWEQWLHDSRVATDRDVVDTLERLARIRERAGQHQEALRLAGDVLSIDRWNERAHLRTVRLLALSGRRAQALEHARRFVADLRDELDATPPQAMVSLVQRLRSGVPSGGQVTPTLPDRPSTTPAPCVAREPELAWLDRHLDDAVAGRGHLVAVTGSAGAGKSVLLQTFAARSHLRMPALTVLRGGCNAYGGAGDSYLPFRQMLGLLCGDLEPAWLRGDLAMDEAAALWAGVPAAVDAVLEVGPALLGPLIDTRGLQERLPQTTDDDGRAARLAAAVSEVARRGASLRAQQPVLDHTMNVVARLSRDRPLLLMVDDLHAADQGTLDLVRHLAAGIGSVPVLVVVALRPALSQRSGHEPVGEMLAEVRSRSPDECVLDLVGDRAFVDAWLDVEPNLLDEGFRHRLHRATHGHALFTVEMVAALKRRGVLARDRDGRWRAEAVDWGTLPPRVEAMVEARVLALAPDVRRDLEVAAVQGPEFTCEVVAALRGAAPAEVTARLDDLTRSASALVDDLGMVRVGSTRVGRYRFRHLLFQQYLYGQLREGDRSRMHAATAQALAALHTDAIDDVVGDLARHADAAGDDAAAASYHRRAGEIAAARSALADAAVHLRRALALVERQPAGPDRDRARIGLLTLLGACVQARAGYNAPATRAVYDELREVVGGAAVSMESAEAVAAMIGLDGLRAHYGDAIAEARLLLSMSTQLAAPALATIAHMELGWLGLMTADLAGARRHLDEAIDGYDPAWDGWLTPLVGFHVRSTARAWRALLAAVECRPDDARADGAEAIREARVVGFPYGVVFALSVGGCAVHEQLLDAEPTVAFADEVADIARHEGFAFYQAAALVHRGLGMGHGGRTQTGVAQTTAGLAAWSELGTEAFRTWMMCELVLLMVEAGDVAGADHLLDEIDQRIAIGEERLANCWEPLARAAVQRAHGDLERAEQTLARATEGLAEIGAGQPLLRVATARAAVLGDQGRPEAGAAVLVPVVSALTQGLDTPVVRQALDLLDRLVGADATAHR